MAGLPEGRGAHAALDGADVVLAQVAVAAGEDGDDEVLAGRARGHEVDDRVPEAHEREHDPGHVGEAQILRSGMHEGEDPEGGGRHPGDQQGEEEQQRHFRVAPCRPIRLHGGVSLLLRLRAGAGAGVLGYAGSAFLGRRCDIDAVGFVDLAAHGDLWTALLLRFVQGGWMRVEAFFDCAKWHNSRADFRGDCDLGGLEVGP